MERRLWTFLQTGGRPGDPPELGEIGHQVPPPASIRRPRSRLGISGISRRQPALRPRELCPARQGNENKPHPKKGTVAFQVGPFFGLPETGSQRRVQQRERQSREAITDHGRAGRRGHDRTGLRHPRAQQVRYIISFFTFSIPPPPPQANDDEQTTRWERQNRYYISCCTTPSRDLDFINILSYDYHVASEPQVNHHAPLRARSNFDDAFDPNEELNIVRVSFLSLKNK